MYERSSDSGNVTERERDSSPHPLYRWRKAMEQGGETTLSGKRAKVDPRIKELEEENRKLKEAPAIQSPVCVQRTGRS